MSLVSQIKKPIMILQGRKQEALKIKNDFTSKIERVNFTTNWNTTYENIQNDIPLNCSELINACENSIRMYPQDKSNTYLEKLIKKAQNLNDSITNLKNITYINLKTIHQCFKALSKQFKEIYSAKFLIHTKAIINHKKTQNKFKELYTQLSQAEKKFSELTPNECVKKIYDHLKKLENSKDVLTAQNNIKQIIYFPKEQLGKYSAISFKTSFEHFDNLPEQKNHIYILTHSLCKTLTKQSYDFEIYDDLLELSQSFKTNLISACNICQLNFDSADIVYLPCNHPICKKCLKKLLNDKKQKIKKCPLCNTPIPQKYKYK